MAGNIVRIKNYWYNDIDSLGAGSFGEVFKGHDDENKVLLLAIKRIPLGPQMRKQEIKILQDLSKIKNAHIVSLISALETEKYFYLVMEYCNGGDLDQYLREKKRMDELRLRTFLQQIASALKILRENDIIHRDLKPANILLTYCENHITFKIADFGLGRFLNENSKAGTQCGTLVYKAPEFHVENPTYDYKVDLYSVGAIVYQCFTGNLYFDYPEKFPSDMNPELRDLITRLVREDPKERLNFDDFYNHQFIYPKKVDDLKKKAKHAATPDPEPSICAKAPLDIQPSMAGKKYENCAVVVGLNAGLTVAKDVVKINLCRPHEMSSEAKLPATMQIEVFAAVYCNTMYVVGIGDNRDQIWKYDVDHGWKKCASLAQGRRKHSAAFIDEVLYICGGYVDSDENVLRSVEAYNAVTDKCTEVGVLAHRVKSSGNCVPFKSSIYIFGGKDADNKELKRVQMYNTKENTCSVLQVPMPRPCSLMRAVLWKTSAILVGCDSCFIFNFETETWKDRKKFKTDAIHFGLILENERLFVIGGGDFIEDKDGSNAWKCRDDVRYVPLQNIIDDNPIEWKIHAKLPTKSLVYAFGNV